jgi:hypothetical protein
MPSCCVARRSQLDDFEGSGYERVLARVRHRDGGIVTAYVFVIRRAGSNRPKLSRHAGSFARAGAAH